MVTDDCAEKGGLGTNACGVENCDLVSNLCRRCGCHVREVSQIAGTAGPTGTIMFRLARVQFWLSRLAGDQESQD